MTIAVFGTSVSSGFIPVLDNFFCFLRDNKIGIDLYRPFYDFLINEFNYSSYHTGFFSSYEDFDKSADFIFSVGGDGTFLQSFHVIRNFDIPFIGINSGRLGFLTDISQDQVTDALVRILNGPWEIVERTLLQVDISGEKNFEFNFALNEATLMKTDNSSMINVLAYVNNEYLNNYWGDGLIISTPTGSTAYSLSVNGPILTPDAENFIITPIAPHNLAVRPVVVPDSSTLLLKTEGRGTNFRISLDSRSASLDFSATVRIKKAGFKLKSLKLPDHNFFSTLRNKLMWGADKRN